MTSVNVTESPTTVTVDEVTQDVTISTVGVQGPQGATGPQGPQGESGGQYTHTQNSPSAVWTITHNLGYNPNATVLDSAGTTVEGSLSYPSTSTMTITFSASFAGYAYLS